MDRTDPDTVPVLAVVPKDGRQWLVDSAPAFQARPPQDQDKGAETPPPPPEPREDKGEEDLPRGFERDRAFPAIPIGSAHPKQVDFRRNKDLKPLVEELKPENSTYFVIRGYVRPDHPGTVPRSLDFLDLYAEPRLAGQLTCASDRAVGSVDDARARLGTARLWAQSPPLDGAQVALAVVDSGIYLPHLDGATLRRPRPRHPLPPRLAGDPPILDAASSWTPPRLATPPGRRRIGHGTMCAYNALAVAPKATLLDYPALIARPPGDHTVKATVGAALQAYAGLLAFWIGNVVNGGPYRALVVNNSWGVFHPSEEGFPPGHPGRFIDNLNHPFHLLVWFLTLLGADVVFAAGNGGMPCPLPPFLHLTTGSIRGANAYPDVLTVAGCDVNDGRVGYSSQGPAIPMFPQPTPLKPDLAAYTHFLGSQVFGERVPDGGTSTACAVAAGCVAALRSHPSLSPALKPPGDLFAALRATARPVGSAGWNADDGFGIVDPVAAARSLGVPIP